MINPALASCLARLVFACLLLSASHTASACTMLLSADAKLRANAIEMPNAMRVEVARNYLIAREWTAEGAIPAIYAGAYETERNPAMLARRRGEAAKAYLIQLGLAAEDITIDKRIIRMKGGIPQNEDGKQIAIAFVPKCPASGCGDLCRQPVEGAVSRAFDATNRSSPRPRPRDVEPLP